MSRRSGGGRPRKLTNCPAFRRWLGGTWLDEGARVSLLPAIATSWLLGLAGSSFGTGLTGLASIGLGLAGLLAARALLPVPLDRSRWVIVALSMAALSAGLATRVTAPRPVPARGLCRLVVDVIQVQHGVDTVRSDVVVVSGERVDDHRTIPVGLRLATAPLALPLGARVEVLAQLKPQQAFRNPTPHPALPDPDAADASAWLSASAGVRVISQSPLHRAIDRARSAVRHALVTTLSAQSAGLARALVLGEGRAVDAQAADDVRAAGLSHVLAVSGLHVTLVVGALVALLRWLLLWTPLALRFDVRRIACAVGVGLVLLYAPFAGGSASAWRAAVTAAIAWTLVAAGRRPDPAAITAAAALLLSAITPGEVWNAGFALSIVATAAIVSITAPQDQEPSVEDKRTWTHHIRLALVISWRAFVATAPIVLWLFGTLPWIGLVANLLLVPLASVLLLPVVTLHAFFATCLPVIGGVTAPLATWTIDGFVAASAWLGQAPGFSPPPLSWVQGLSLAGLCAAWLLMKTARALGIATSVCVIAFALAEWHLRVTEQPRDILRATFLDVGQGDSALLDMPNGQLMLVDAGGNPNGGPDPGRAVLVPLLQARRRDRIDVVVITHPHPDHYGGLRAIVEAAIPIGEVWDSGQGDAETPDGELSALLRELSSRGTKLRRPQDLCRQPQRFGRARVAVLWPCPTYDPGHDPNDNSLVLRVDHGARSVLLTGDIEGHAEQGLVATQAARLDVDVLKVPHHGSRTSSSQPLLDVVSPRIAVVSSGAFNRYGHPHGDVAERLRHAAQRVVRLDQAGGTIIESDGNTLLITRWADR